MEKIKILAVDDNQGVIDLMTEFFKGSQKVELSFIARDGSEAIQMIKKHQEEIDLILLDIIMPKKDGICVLEEMKEAGISKKVIVQTSYDSIDMIKRVSQMGADYFLTKPYSMEDLEKRVVQIMDGKSIGIEGAHDCKMEVQISKMLHELGIPSHIKGYQYIREGICLIAENPEMIGGITKELYPELAKKFGTTCSRVERAMRHAIEVGWTRSNWKTTDDLFGQSVDFDRTKPTNSEFIVTLADKLRLDSRKVNS